MNEGPRYTHGFANNLLFVCQIGDYDIFVGKTTGRLFATNKSLWIPATILSLDFIDFPEDVKTFMLAHEALRS